MGQCVSGQACRPRRGGPCSHMASPACLTHGRSRAAYRQVNAAGIHVLLDVNGYTGEGVRRQVARSAPLPPDPCKRHPIIDDGLGEERWKYRFVDNGIRRPLPPFSPPLHHTDRQSPNSIAPPTRFLPHKGGRRKVGRAEAGNGGGVGLAPTVGAESRRER